jgi:hypothetical protein
VYLCDGLGGRVRRVHDRHAEQEAQLDDTLPPGALEVPFDAVLGVAAPGVQRRDAVGAVAALGLGM